MKWAKYIFFINVLMTFSSFTHKKQKKIRSVKSSEPILIAKKDNKVLRKIKKHIPLDIYECLKEMWHNFGLSRSPHRVAHLLGQTAHESGNFKHREEIVGFALDRSRTTQLFENRLVTVVENISTEKTRLADYVGEENVTKVQLPISVDSLLDFIFSEEDIDIRKQKLLNIVYGMRINDLGNDTYGDGWKYRGRGYLQITGKRNYIELTKIIRNACPHLDIDLVENPDLIITNYPFITAIAFFYKENLFKICDAGNHNDVVAKVTKVINTNSHGLEYRTMHTERFSKIIGLKVHKPKKKKTHKLKIRHKKKRLKTSSASKL